MEIRVLAFATAAETLGTGTLDLSLPDGATVDRLRMVLVEREPRLGEIWPRIAVAVNGTIATPDTVLPEGAEVALLPPVSGGSPRAFLTEDPLDPAALLAAVAGPDRGAVVLFVGTVRDHHDGRGVLGIAYSAYRTMAEKVLGTIVDEAESREPGVRVAVGHRIGDLEVGEASVVIAAASAHREAAYRASRFVLEELKSRAPIWKRERYADGTAAWREEEPLVKRSS